MTLAVYKRAIVPAVSPKEMLNKLLTTATLTAKEREAFESMWDALHKYGRLSRRQLGWIEEVYYKKDLSSMVRPAPKRARKLGFITDASVKKVLRMRSLESVRLLCPHILPTSNQFKVIEDFFKSGGEVFEVRPSSSVPPGVSKS